MLATLVGALAGCALAGREARPVLRVGTSGDYAPFSIAREDGTLAGLDVELARAYAADRGLEIEWVRFRWPQLAADLAAGRFDVAWSGVTIRPDRSVAGTFTVPTLESGAVVIVPADDPTTRLEDLDHPDRRIGVNRGGHLERVTRARFGKARVVAVTGNHEVPAQLLLGHVDAVVSDTLEAPLWIADSGRRLRALPAFTRDRKAPWVRTDQPERARDLSEWLVAREADGSLARARSRAGIPDAPPTATPEKALRAAQEERLALMPYVAEAKRRSGSPIEVPAREAVVVEAGVTRAREEARLAGLPPLPDAEVARFYREQIEAAKALQREVMAGEPSAEPPPDLVEAVRPALLRIGDRIAWLLLRQPRQAAGSTSGLEAPPGCARGRRPARAPESAWPGPRCPRA